MKYLIATLFTVFALTTNAQKLSYYDGSIDYDGETVQTIDVLLNPNVETIKDKFEDWMDDNYDVDLDGKKLLFFNKEFLTANGVVIPQISDRKIDLMVKVDETQAGLTKLNVFASYGYNNWITENDNPYEFAALRGIVYDFVGEYLPEYYMEQLEESKEVLADLNDDREELQEEVQENQEEITKLKKENDELMMKLRENQKKINTSQSKMRMKNNKYKNIKVKVSDMNKK